MSAPTTQDRTPLSIEALIGIARAFRTLGREWPDPGPPFAPHAVRIIDVRSREAFETAHIPGACRLSADEIDTPYLRPPRKRALLVVAATAAEALEGVRRLHDAGQIARPLGAPVSAWPGPWEEGPSRTPSWEPSSLVARFARRLPGGSVLDLACGAGRDAVYLALQGTIVTAIDILPDALEQAALLAARHGVEIELRRGDVETDADFWKGPWEAIHVHRFLHRPSLPLISDRLAPGGWLLYETFIEEQAHTGRRPHDPAHLLRCGELLETARGLRVLEYHEGENDEGDWVASLVAVKESADAAR